MSRRFGRSATRGLVVFGFLGAALFSNCGTAPAIAADAEPPALAPPPGFALQGSDGYSVEVSGVASQDDSPAQVIVRVAKRRGSVTYRFPGIVAAGSIEADLGSYGLLSVVFHPLSGGMGGSEFGCSHGLSSAAGYYEGTISFHASGLTEVEASSAKGSIGLGVDLLCAAELEKEEPRLPGVHLEVSGGRAAPTLTVLQRRRGDPAEVIAGISERRGGVAVERSINLEASASSFGHQGLRSATLRLPAPFSGSAAFGRVGPRGDWRGNLRVDFPGRAGVALTGEGLRASLRRGHGG